MFHKSTLLVSEITHFYIDPTEALRNREVRGIPTPNYSPPN